ncbi:MAG: hypothetical protein CSA81_01400 [Acidobacteria bacterium]|nr:MAG: hypothetical protein CSA81_01400 [Acidobacteriota bacterium]
MKKKNRAILFSFFLILVAFTWACGSHSVKNKVQVELPLPPKLDVGQYKYLVMPGFYKVPGEDVAQGVRVGREAVNFFRREIMKNGNIEWVDVEPVDFSEIDPETFFVEKQPFFEKPDFKNAKETIALCGTVKYQVFDRSGFQTFADVDRYGRMYNKTIFVEKTGYQLNMMFYIYDLETGKLIHRESMQDELDLNGPAADNRLAFYELAQRMANRVISLFTDTQVKAERTLL